MVCFDMVGYSELAADNFWQAFWFQRQTSTISHCPPSSLLDTLDWKAHATDPCKFTGREWYAIIRQLPFKRVSYSACLFIPFLLFFFQSLPMSSLPQCQKGQLKP